MEKKFHFYLIYPIGLVEFGLLELKEKYLIHFPFSSLEVIEINEGGILIEVPLFDGFLLNHILRTPTRILLRISHFKARDFPKLYQKISKLSLKNFLIGQIPDVEVSTLNSRLFDSRKIIKAVQDGIVENYKKQPLKKIYLEYLARKGKAKFPHLYYRAVNDQITLSIDTSGEILHKRGDKILTGHAPLRENLAALLLYALTKDLSLKNLHLVDPMCGAGTFLLEAHDFYSLNTERNFAYEHFPLWIDYPLKNKALHDLKIIPNEFFKKIEGHDIDKNQIAFATKNIEGKKIELSLKNVFEQNMQRREGCLAIVNPPYGHRIGEKNEITSEYYKKIILQIKKNYSPLRMGIIIPEEFLITFSPSEIISSIPFKNGGIPVVFYVLK